MDKNITWETDFKAALSKAKDESKHLRMPGMDGFALQKRINELRFPLEIIILTADAQPGDREQALREGAIGFLQKPFHEESLFELIKKVIKNTN